MAFQLSRSLSHFGDPVSHSVAVVGPNHGLPTGQSIALKIFCSLSSNQINLISNGGEGLVLRKKLLLSFTSVAKVVFACLRGSNCIYVTVSRSWLGFLREAPVFLVAHLFRVPLIVHCHGADFPNFIDSLKPWQRWIVSSTYRFVDEVIVLSNAMIQQFDPGSLTYRISVVNNPIPGCDLLLRIDKNPRSSLPLRVLFLSNLMPEKGLCELIDAINIVNHAAVPGLSEVELAIAGGVVSSKMSADDLQARIGTNASIVYHGVADEKRKVELLDWADVVALPTYYPTEAVPLCLLEGLAAGCHLLSTRAGFIEDELREASITFIEKRDPTDLANALHSLSKRLPALAAEAPKNRMLAKSKFYPSDYAKKIDNIIDEAIAVNCGST